jgi:hypothetical protein
MRPAWHEDAGDEDGTPAFTPFVRGRDDKS